MRRTGRRMGALLAVMVSAFAPALCAQTTDVALGIEALTRRDVAGAMTVFTRATSNPNPALRVAGEQWRGHVAWHVLGDTAGGSAYLARALEQARDSANVLVELARLYAFRGRYTDGMRAARDAMTAQDAEQRGLAARALVGVAVDAMFAAPRPGDDSVRAELIALARDTLRSRVVRFPGRTSDAMGLIQAGLLTRSDSDVAAGIASYFLLTEPRIPVGVTPVGWTAVASALADLRLHECAALAVRLRPPGAEVPARLADVVAYGTFMRAMREAAEDYYRRALARTARPGDLDRAFIAQSRRLWSALRWDGSPPSFYPAALAREIDRRFGATLSIENAGGTSELYFAHRIGARPLKLERGTATLVTLDGVVARGLDSWLLDDAGGRAGWVHGDTIYQVRTGFTETGFRAWSALTEPEAMPGEALRIARDSAADIDRAKADSLGYLPGVAARVFRQGALEVLDSLFGVPRLEHRDRLVAFTRMMYLSLTESSIELHEGRHVLDLRSARWPSDAVAEFRAKVEEVSRASRPRLAMTAILSPRIGDRSAHGQANRRVMTELNRWIRANGRTIAGYDPAAPALLSLPKLTDAQLRQAFASMRRP